MKNENADMYEQLRAEADRQALYRRAWPDDEDRGFGGGAMIPRKPKPSRGGPGAAMHEPQRVLEGV